MSNRAMDGGFDERTFTNVREEFLVKGISDITKYTSRTTLPGFGGARRDRTADPLLAKQVLSQLSYGP